LTNPKRLRRNDIPVPNILPIHPLQASSEAEIQALSDVLIDCVEGGASVGFMHPLSRAKANDFWIGVAAGVARGERILLGAHDTEGTLLGTVQVVFAQFENQPHRADVAKMLVHRCARRQGIGAALLAAAERAALSAGRTLLVLDTASADAERLYAKLGWRPCGVVPAFALLPGGGFCDTTFFYRTL
jgi:GNAT superfamily N-acetyltransferase